MYVYTLVPIIDPSTCLQEVQTFSNDLTRGLCMQALLFYCGQLLNYGRTWLECKCGIGTPTNIYKYKHVSSRSSVTISLFHFTYMYYIYIYSAMYTILDSETRFTRCLWIRLQRDTISFLHCYFVE